jgi:DNA-binding NtrC family response regulator
MTAPRSQSGCTDIPIVLLEDDEGFRTGLSELLREDGHRVEAFGSIAEVPEPSALQAGSVLVTDYQLGSGDGLGFAQRFHAVHPGAPVIVVTAYASAHLTQAAAALPYLSVLRKPLLYDELHELIHRRSAP